MNSQTHRRLSAVLGAFLVLLAGGGVWLLGGNVAADPVLAAQVALLGLAGIVDLVAAFDSPLTELWAWYRWHGLGNVLLGVSLPLGFLNTGDHLVFLVVATIGGLSLGAMGVDLLVFHGQYTRGERMDKESS